MSSVFDVLQRLEVLRGVGGRRLPSGLVIQPPACTMNAPIRSRVSPMTSGVMPLRLELLRHRGELVPGGGHVGVGQARPSVHRSVLIFSASVEKSFGAQ